MTTTRRLAVTLAAAAALLLAGCGSSTTASSSTSSSPTSAAATQSSAAGSEASSGTSAADTGGSSDSGAGTGSSAASSSAAPLSGELDIYAASSLKVTFDQLKADFEKANPGVTVKPIVYDGSSTLVTQIIGGAAADVFASADDKNMKKITDATLASDPTEFATNTLEIATPPGNPKKITSLKDLANADLKVVLCDDGVPCGSAAITALKAGGVTVTPVSKEQNVTAVLTKVEAGEADAGIVYQTDVKSAGAKVTGVNFPEAAKAINHYPIIALTASKNQSAAKAFIDLVTGPTGQQVLAAAGFGKP